MVTKTAAATVCDCWLLLASAPGGDGSGVDCSDNWRGKDSDEDQGPGR